MPEVLSRECTMELDQLSTEELLLLVADDAKGCKLEALGRVAAMDRVHLEGVLETALRDNANADLRNGAMEVYVKLSRQALPWLFALLQDADEEIRNFVAVMLGDIGNREAVGPLITALRDPDVNVRHAAAEALGKIGDRGAFDDLVALLTEDFWVQYPAVVALGEMRDNRAVPHLLPLLDEEMLAVPVAEALGKIGDPRALQSLARQLAEGVVAAEAARSIVSIYRGLDDSFSSVSTLAVYNQTLRVTAIVDEQGKEALRRLLFLSPDDAGAAVTLLGWLGDDCSIPRFLDLLENEALLEVTEGALLSIGATALAYLPMALHHPVAAARRAGVRLLHWLGDESRLLLLLPLLAEGEEELLLEVLDTVRGHVVAEFREPLSRLVRDPRRAVRKKALEVVAGYADEWCRLLLEELAASRLPLEREAAACLAGLLAEPAAEVLEALAADPAPEVRCRAAAGIPRGATRYVPLLVRLLRDEDEAVREQALDVLSALGNEAPLDAVVELLGEGSEAVDYAVIRAIGAIGRHEGGLRLLGYLSSGPVSRSLEFAAVRALGLISDDDCVPMIRRYLFHSDPDVRRLAVETLGKRGEPRALDDLENALADPHWSVRNAAAAMLGKLKGDRALSLLLVALDDEDVLVRKNAIVALGEVGDGRATTRLVSFLPDMELSRHAFEALLRLHVKALPWLHRIMKKEYPREVRKRVIDILGRIGDRRSIYPLIDLLDDSDPEIRVAAIDSLIFCFDTVLLKKLSEVRKVDAHDEVRARADLAIRILTRENFF